MMRLIFGWLCAVSGSLQVPLHLRPGLRSEFLLNVTLMSSSGVEVQVEGRFGVGGVNAYLPSRTLNQSSESRFFDSEAHFIRVDSFSPVEISLPPITFEVDDGPFFGVYPNGTLLSHFNSVDIINMSENPVLAINQTDESFVSQCSTVPFRFKDGNKFSVAFSGYNPTAAHSFQISAQLPDRLIDVPETIRVNIRDQLVLSGTIRVPSSYGMDWYRNCDENVISTLPSIEISLDDPSGTSLTIEPQEYMTFDPAGNRCFIRLGEIFPGRPSQINPLRFRQRNIRITNSGIVTVC